MESASLLRYTHLTPDSREFSIAATPTGQQRALHRKNTRDGFREYPGDEIVDRFPEDRLVNHDPEYPDGIVSLGETDHGDVVEVNRAVVEADLAIMIGRGQGNPYGGFSGGDKMPSTSLTTWYSGCRARSAGYGQEDTGAVVKVYD